MSDSPGIFRTVVESITAVAVAWIAFQQAKIKGDVNKIELSINSRMDNLLQTTKDLARAKGISDEKERAAAITDKPKEP